MAGINLIDGNSRETNENGEMVFKKFRKIWRNFETIS